MSVHRTLLAAGVAALAGAAPAAAAEPIESGGLTAPAYPGNTVSAALTVDGPVVAGTLQTADLAGHAEFRDDYSRYTPALFVQDTALDDACAPTLAQQRQKFINNTAVSAVASTPWVLDEGQFSIAPAPGTLVSDWKTTTQPFTIRPGVREVLLCTYVRYVVDDVAFFGARYAVAQPACRPTAKRIRAGRKLGIRCNVSGKLSARLRRGAKTVKRVIALGSDQRATFSTRGARKGVNRLAFSLDGKTYGTPIRVRVT